MSGKFLILIMVGAFLVSIGIALFDFHIVAKPITASAPSHEHVQTAAIHQ